MKVYQTPSDDHRDAQANRVARNLLRGTGMTIATMDATTYERVMKELRRAGLA